MTDTYDDGLVHSHNWASEPATAASGRKLVGAATTSTLTSISADEAFDDGLVHGHDWARG